MIPFALVEVPTSAPFRCPCGSGLPADGPFLWTGLPGEGGGDLFLCAHCLRRAVEPLEFVPKTDFVEVAERLSVVERSRIDEQEQLAAARRELHEHAGREERDAGEIAQLRDTLAANEAEWARQLTEAKAGSGPQRIAAANLELIGAAAVSTKPVRSKATTTKGAA